MRYSIFCVIGFVLLNSCVEPFQPNIKKYEDILVVDAILTTDNTAALVKLSRSYPYNEKITTDESDAIVRIVSDMGLEYQLNESSAGSYTSGSDLKPKIGEKYKLYIKTQDEQEYESSYQEIIPSPPVDSVYYRVVQGNQFTSGTSVPGVEIFVNAHDDNNRSHYYRWEWEETWEIHSPYHFDYTPRRCFLKDNSSGIIIANTVNLIQDQVKDQYLFFVSSGANKLIYRYSVIVKQMVLSRDNYMYLTKLRESNITTGGFFDPIPASISGNVKNISHPDIPVLGIFIASALTTKRIFISGKDLHFQSYGSTGFEDCQSVELPVNRYRKGELHDWHYMYEYFNSQYQDTLVFLINYTKCYDCSAIADPVTPDYWKD